MLALREGTVDMHGLPSVRTWTRLANTTNIGATKAVLLQPVDWPIGSQIVVATTGDHLSQKQSEVRTIVAVSSDGLTLTLDAPLVYPHLGMTQTLGSTSVEMRAEVGLLSHNVVFRGSTDASWSATINPCPQGFNPGEFAVQTCFLGRYGEEMGSDEFGASIMVSTNQDNADGIQRAILRLSNVEVMNSRCPFELYIALVHSDHPCRPSISSWPLSHSLSYERKYEPIVHQILVDLSDIQSCSEYPCIPLHHHNVRSAIVIDEESARM